MFRQLLKIYVITIMLMYSYQSQAIAISSLFEVADPKTHLAEITIINNEAKTMFISFQMGKVHYKNGKKTVENLNKNNVDKWTFRVSPTQIILKAGERRVVRMFNNCGDNCDFSKDQIYVVSVTPIPYSSGKISSVAFSFGYKVYFYDPVKTMHIDYVLKRVSKTEIYFNNRSNTMLTAVLSMCETDFNNNCTYQYRLLPNTKRKFTLPDKVMGESKLRFTVINANEIYHERIIL